MGLNDQFKVIIIVTARARVELYLKNPYFGALSSTARLCLPLLFMSSSAYLSLAQNIDCKLILVTVRRFFFFKLSNESFI